MPNDKQLPVESPNAACPQQRPGGRGWGGACVLQGVWVKLCTCAQLQLPLPQPLLDGAGGHRDRDTICKPGSGQPPPVRHIVFIKNAQRSVQLSSAKHGVVACPQHPG